jgi:hypothetical protein
VPGAFGFTSLNFFAHSVRGRAKRAGEQERSDKIFWQDPIVQQFNFTTFTVSAKGHSWPSKSEKLKYEKKENDNGSSTPSNKI